MEDPLQKLIRDLRSDRCPDSVMEQVQRRTATRPSVPPRSRYAAPLAAFIVAAAFAMVVIWKWPQPSNREPLASAEISPDHALVIQQTHGALINIGHLLLEAAAHTESALLEEAVPPMRTGFRSLKAKVANSI